MSNSIDTDEHLREIDALIDSERFPELLERTERLLAAPQIPAVEADLRRARALARTALRDWPAALAEWDRVVELLPERASSHRGRGAARERAGDSAGAVADFARSVELTAAQLAHRDILSTCAVRRDAAWTHALDAFAHDQQDARLHVRGFCCCGGGHQGPQIQSPCYHKRGYCNRAEDVFTRTLEENPDNIQAWFDRASVRHCRRNWDGVIADCTRALALKPDFAAAHGLRGSAHDKKGDLLNAVADWTAAIELRPQDVMTYSLRALAYEILGRDAEARADRVRAFELCTAPASEPAQLHE